MLVVVAVLCLHIHSCEAAAQKQQKFCNTSKIRCYYIAVGVDNSLEISPVLANVEHIVANCLAAVLLHELWAIALDKVKAPALKADVIHQPLHPVY